MQCKNLNVLAEDFEDWAYRSNRDVDDETYLVAFVVTWLSRKVFVNSSTVV